MKLQVDDLPPEIITEILSFVSTKNLIYNISFLSKKWFQLSSNIKILEFRCERDNFTNFSMKNISKQISIYKRNHKEILKPYVSHLKRQFFHYEFLKKEMRFETDFHNIIKISENGRNIKVKYQNDTDKHPYDEDDDDDKITACSSSYNNKLFIFYFEIFC